MRIHWRYVAAAVVLVVFTFAASLWAFPEWAGSLRLLVTLAVAAVVGVVAFLASARQAFEKQPPPDTKPSEPPQIQIAETQTQNIGAQVGGQGSVGGNLLGLKDVTAGGNVIAVAGNYVAPPLPTISPLHQLSSPPADFTGREAELNELREKIRQGGAIISGLHGLGGVGKTALALKLADELKAQYPDAQFHVDLGGVSEAPLSPADALSRIIHAFQPEAKLPESVDELRPIFLSLLHGKKALLLMDNAKDGEQVKPLIPPAACLLLVTSRQHFRLPGLHSKDVDTLPPDEARELLVKIAPRLAASHPSTTGGKTPPSAQDASAVDEIASLCGCLPLALCAAGSLLAVTPDLAPADYIAQLRDERTRLERIGKEGVDISVEASLNLSYKQLAEETARVFRCLSVFPATFDAAAEEVIGQDAEHRQLSELVKRSLVRYGIESGRYGLHVLVRLFARSQLPDPNSYEAQKRHAIHYENVLRGAKELYKQGGDSAMRGLALFDAERLNIEAGQTWAVDNAERDNDAVQLCNTYSLAGMYILDLRLHPRERIRWIDAALIAARRLHDPHAESAHLVNLGLAYADFGEPRKAIRHYEQALAIVHETGDRWVEGAALGNLGAAHFFLGELRKATKYYEQDLTISREMGDRRAEGDALNNLGLALATLGDLHRAIEFYEQRLVIAQGIGDKHGEGSTLSNLGLAYAALGEPRKAIELNEQALVIVRELGYRRGEGEARNALGMTQAALGEPRKAIELYERALEIARDIGDIRSEGSVLGNLGNVYIDLGELSKAIECHWESLLISRQIGDRRGEGAELGNLGVAYVALGEIYKAIELHKQHLLIAREIGDRRSESNALGNLGNAHSGLGEVQRAIEYYEQALEIARETGDKRCEGQALGNLGACYSALGDAPRAIENYEQSLIVKREIKDRRGEGNTLFNMSTALYKLGEQDRAIACAETALKVFEQIEDPNVEMVRQELAEWRSKR